MKTISTFITNYYYFCIIPFLSIAIFFVMQYLTRGISYFVGTNGIKWGFLSFMAILQFLVSICVTWSVLSAFNSDFLSDYDTLKMTFMIILGSAPFNVTILVWIALKLETYKLMRNRYGDDFKDDDFFKKVEAIEEAEKEAEKEASIENIKIKNVLLNKENIQDKKGIE